MNEEFSEVRELLERWGEWARLGMERNGMPSITTIGRMVREGAVIQGGGRRNSGDDPECEEMDMILCQMPRGLRKIVLARYLWNKGNTEAAKICRMSVASYKNMMNVALGWIHGHRKQRG